MPKRCKHLGIRTRGRPPELSLLRFAVGKLYASRMGHGEGLAWAMQGDGDVFCARRGWHEG